MMRECHQLWPPRFGRIDCTEFLHAFARIWHPALRSQRRDSVLNVGLAVSGGVDSMALTSLCSSLHEVDLTEFLFVSLAKLGFHRQQRLSFKAFIVDHGARVGSDEEASLVSKNLEKIGLPAQILRLQWPSGCRPAELSNFESVARKLRYQALGKACYEHEIQPLLTAHHEDDQVETVVMRLLRGEKGTNLHGMRPVSHIPECHGIYGGNRSGVLSSQLEQSNDENLTSGLKGLKPISISMESGGVRLYRPLLNFSKSRLIRTAIENGTNWFEDKTNADPTLTPRNTIRHFYKNDLMPEALSKTAILQLAHKMQKKGAAEESRANSLFSKPYVMNDINWNSGSLKVRFPKIAKKETDKKARNLEKRRAAKFLRHLIYFVTPNENVLLSTLGTACEAVFPDLFSEGTAERYSIPKKKQAQAFTVASVNFKRMDVPLSLPAEELGDKLLDIELDEESMWVLSRQAYKRSEELPCITFPPASISPRESLDSALSDKSWSPWHLYDGRFWIRISNRSSSTITIRPFNKYDMNRFDTWPKHMYSKKEGQQVRSSDADDISKEEFVRFMKKQFPGNIRYTLPAIVTMDEGRETVLALPSVGIACRNMEEMGLDWDIRYKCVDWLPSTLMDS